MAGSDTPCSGARRRILRCLWQRALEPCLFLVFLFFTGWRWADLGQCVYLFGTPPPTKPPRSARRGGERGPRCARGRLDHLTAVSEGFHVSGCPSHGLAPSAFCNLWASGRTTQRGVGRPFVLSRAEAEAPEGRERGQMHTNKIQYLSCRGALFLLSPLSRVLFSRWEERGSSELGGYVQYCTCVLLFPASS